MKKKCLDVVEGANVVQLWSCVNNHNNQLFEVAQDGGIVVKSTFECLGFEATGGKRHNGYPKENDPVIVVQCHTKNALKWTYLDVKPDTFYSVLKPQAAKNGPLSTKEDLNQDDGYSDQYLDEDDGDSIDGLDNTYLDRFRKFLLLLSFLFFLAFCSYLLYFIIRRNQTGRGKKNDERV